MNKNISIFFETIKLIIKYHGSATTFEKIFHWSRMIIIVIILLFVGYDLSSTL